MWFSVAVRWFWLWTAISSLLYLSKHCDETHVIYTLPTRHNHWPLATLIVQYYCLWCSKNSHKSGQSIFHCYLCTFVKQSTISSLWLWTITSRVLLATENIFVWLKIAALSDLSPWHTYEKLLQVNSREELVRVSYRLAARYFSCEFLASNRACFISCNLLVRFFGASFSYEFLVRLSWALF